MYCQVTRDPIEPAELIRHVRRDEDGAVVLFVGVVRNHDRERSVYGLEYQAYESMTREVLERICEETRSRFDVGDIAVVHRVGDLGIGAVSVAIAVAAPHRDAAYAASRELIERLKQEAPIWKREHYADGATEWLDGRVPGRGDTDTGR